MRKIWTRLILWKPSSLLSQGRSRARQGGARPNAPLGYKYNSPRRPKRVIHSSIHQRAADTKEKHREEADIRHKSSSCLGDGLGHALAIMVWPFMVKPWWSCKAATWIRQVVCTFNIRWWYKSILVFTLIYYELCFFICVATICF
jgi:hypothetical protein